MTITLEHVTLFYKKSGTGPPLLLLHGNGEDHLIFNPLGKKLSQFYTVYAIDSPNHGKSGRHKEISYQAMARDITDFLVALDLIDVALVGFSDGGILGLLLGIQQNPRLTKMALLGPNLSPNDFTADVLKSIQEDYQATNNPLAKLMLEEPHISLKSINTVEIPTLIIGGQFDCFKPTVLDSIAQHLPQGSLLTVNGHDHSSYIVDNDLLAEPLLTFFNN